MSENLVPSPSLCSFFHVLFLMLTELFLSYLSFYSFFLLLLTILHFLLLLFIFSKLISLMFPSFCHSHYLNIFHSCFKSPPFPHFSNFHLVPFLLLIIIKILLFIVSFAFFNFFFPIIKQKLLFIFRLVSVFCYGKQNREVLIFRVSIRKHVQFFPQWFSRDESNKCSLVLCLAGMKRFVLPLSFFEMFVRINYEARRALNAFT